MSSKLILRLWKPKKEKYLQGLKRNLQEHPYRKYLVCPCKRWPRTGWGWLGEYHLVDAIPNQEGWDPITPLRNKTSSQDVSPPSFLIFCFPGGFYKKPMVAAVLTVNYRSSDPPTVRKPRKKSCLDGFTYCHSIIAWGGRGVKYDKWLDTEIFLDYKNSSQGLLTPAFEMSFITANLSKTWPSG